MIWTNKYIKLLLLILIVSCGGSSIPSDPLKEMRRDFNSKEAYTVLLQDMNLKDGQYSHKYCVFDFTGSTVTVSHSDWTEVDDYFFSLHEDNLGMEVLSKNLDGKINNLVAPPGFTNVIDNDEYGSWELKDTVACWTFNKKYTDLETDLGLKGLTIPKSEFVNYKQTFLNNKPYYGPKTSSSGDSTKYGTRSHHWFILYPSFYTRRTNANNFTKPKSIFTKNTNRGGGGFGK
jgi:hypothetical protein